MSGSKIPRLLEFSAIGDPSIGYLSIAAVEAEIPFPIQRVFWTYDTPEHVTRGRHAHHATETVLVAVVGRIVVFTEMPNGDTAQFILDTPQLGVYLPPDCWRTMTYGTGSVQMALASTDYAAEDYIRSYDEFRQVGGE